MRREDAKAIMDACSAMDSAMKQACDTIERIEDEAERKDMRRAIATAISCVFEVLMIPILRQFPDLDPDRKHSE